jgi:hypothetical protein
MEDPIINHACVCMCCCCCLKQQQQWRWAITKALLGEWRRGRDKKERKAEQGKIKQKRREMRCHQNNGELSLP